MTKSENANNSVRVTLLLSLHSENLTVQQISDRIGITPDSRRSKGQPNSAGTLLDKSSWTLKIQEHFPETPDDVIAGMNASLAQLFSRIADRLEAFRQLAIEEEASLIIGITARCIPPMVIAGDNLGIMCSLKLRRFEIDLIT